MHALDAIHLANGLSGIAYVALGVFVLSVRARDPTNLAFGVFALAWATVVFVSNFWLEVGHASLLALFARPVLGTVIVASLAVLVARYPRPVERSDRARILVALALAFPAFFGPAALGSVVELPTGLAVHLTLEVVRAAFDLGYWAILLFLAFRWPTLDSAGRRATALISAALVLWPSFSLGEIIVLGEPSVVVDLVPSLALVVAWLANAARGTAREARHVAWLTLAAMLAAMVERTAFPAAPDLWGYGLSRLAGVALLAYAIVRHQLLGIDVKVRWTLSKSTVAAAFVAAFFVASEGAQLLFGQENQIVGLIAAGALVFAISPLQRAADRLAERAVPVAGAPMPAAPTAGARPQHEEAFRAAVRLALRGGITRREELELARIADAHGLSAVRAHELRDETEREYAA